MVDRISASDTGYSAGDLSVYPTAIDSETTLYKVANNAVATLKQTLSFNGKIVIVDDTTGFPDNGIIRVGPLEGVASAPELIYYDSKTSNTFQNLKRGFSGSRQNQWIPDGKTIVTNSVVADTHNAVKDAIINIEQNLGLKTNPDEESLNGILTAQEVRFLTPRPLFRAFPLKGPPSLQVRFQNFTTGHIIRYLWDFGDGGTSLDKSPVHTYFAAGVYTVKLNIITSTGGQGIVTKTDYITVDDDEVPSFFYVDSTSSPYSTQTAAELTTGGTPTSPKEFLFIDQTDGDIVQRNWIFDDGSNFEQQDPDVHTATHIFATPGEYTVSLLVVFSDGRLKTAKLPGKLTVL
jgi:PKD repeat protein